MANLRGHHAWASVAEIIEDYAPAKAQLVRCMHQAFMFEVDGNGKVQTYTEKFPWAIVENGYVHYYATEAEARQYAHEHALDLAKSIQKGKN